MRYISILIFLTIFLVACKKKEVNLISAPTISSTITYNTNLTYGSVKDVDGNTYKTITISGEEWMAENLKVTRYNDSTPIPFVFDSVAWINLSDAGYCLYKNNPTNKDLYGLLYNYYVISTKNVCPKGWHIPSDEEWSNLTNVLGTSVVAGGKMKEAGDSHWIGLNELTSNSSGFTALPGGVRDYDGVMVGQRYMGYWWTSLEQSADFAYVRYLHNDAHCERSYILKNYGISIRCLKD